MEHAVELPASLASAQAKPVLLEYYTNPQCCQSWAFESSWQRLQVEFGYLFAWRYRMVLPAQQSSSVSFTNAQWDNAQRGRQVDSDGGEAMRMINNQPTARQWWPETPGSSYLACLAVKCAGLQGEQAGELYLRAARAAAMRQGCNINCPEVLAAIAQELSVRVPTVFDAATFRQDLTLQAGAGAFHEDLQHAQQYQSQGFPAIVVLRGTAAHVLPVGHQPYETLLQTLTRLAPNLFYVASLADGGAG